MQKQDRCKQRLEVDTGESLCLNDACYMKPWIYICQDVYSLQKEKFTGSLAKPDS
jgi:hypothetical protein